MCGIVGVRVAASSAYASYEACEGLQLLQHRGQDAAGIASLNSNGFHIGKGQGLVRDVFNSDELGRLQGSLAIGHTRYPTAGGNEQELVQPLVINSPVGIAISHNGNLVNSRQLTQLLETKYQRHVLTDSDSEVLLNVFASALQHQRQSAFSRRISSQRSDGPCNSARALMRWLCSSGMSGYLPFAIREESGLCSGVGGQESAAGKSICLHPRMPR